MKKEGEFIKVRRKHFPIVFNFLQQLWENKKLDRKRTKKYFLYRLRSKRYKMFLMKLEGEIVGYTSYKIEKDFEFGPLCYVDEIVVLKNLRGKGIGSMIIKFLEKTNKEKCNMIRLHTDLVRKKTRNFYKKKKFKDTGVVFEKKLK
jgi:GNAT superfamily N-acetyltransferase